MTSPSYRATRLAIYALKRRRPTSVTLYRTTGDATDPATGVYSAVAETLVVNRAVILPNTKKRSFDYDLTYIANNKNFTYGALFDTNSRVLLIDRRDVPPSFPLDLNMTVIFDGSAWRPTQMVEHDSREVFILSLEQLDQTVFNAITNPFVPPTPSITGYIPSPWVVKTADYAIPAPDGTTYATVGASGPINFTLPAGGVAGDELSFVVAVAQLLTVTAPGGQTIEFGASTTGVGGNVSSSTPGSALTLRRTGPTTWFVVDSNGNWDVS